jgi:hypothetical protein
VFLFERFLPLEYRQQLSGGVHNRGTLAFFFFGSPGNIRQKSRLRCVVSYLKMQIVETARSFDPDFFFHHAYHILRTWLVFSILLTKSMVAVDTEKLLVPIPHHQSFHQCVRSVLVKRSATWSIRRQTVIFLLFLLHITILYLSFPTFIALTLSDPFPSFTNSFECWFFALFIFSQWP